MSIVGIVVVVVVGAIVVVVVEVLVVGAIDVDGALVTALVAGVEEPSPPLEHAEVAINTVTTRN